MEVASLKEYYNTMTETFYMCFSRTVTCFCLSFTDPEI